MLKMVAALMDERGLAQPPPMDKDAAFHAAKKVSLCVSLLLVPPLPHPFTLDLLYSKLTMSCLTTFKRHLQWQAGEQY